jgi:serine/threonine-protein kinase
MAEQIKIVCKQCKTRLDVTELEPHTVFECPVCQANIRVPERFGRYLLDKVIGKGGTSQIYRAIDPQLARWVAIKILDETEETIDIKDRLLQEAKIISRINHPGIVPIYDGGIINDRAYITMRYMENGDLENLLKEDKLPPQSKLFKYFLQVTEGLEAANDVNVVHHDIKPSNIMLTADDDAKLGDFDLADIRQPGDITTPCPEWGSPGYASPERLLNGDEDSAGDIFSLGVTFYELLSKALPFGIHGTAEELYERRRNMTFAALCVRTPKVDKNLSDLISSMLDFFPENRPSYFEIIKALKEHTKE